jgi:hypothetical protein
VAPADWEQRDLAGEQNPAETLLLNTPEPGPRKGSAEEAFDHAGLSYSASHRTR